MMLLNHTSHTGSTPLAAPTKRKEKEKKKLSRGELPCQRHRLRDFVVGTLDCNSLFFFRLLPADHISHFNID